MHYNRKSSSHQFEILVLEAIVKRQSIEDMAMWQQIDSSNLHAKLKTKFYFILHNPHHNVMIKYLRGRETPYT